MYFSDTTVFSQDKCLLKITISVEYKNCRKIGKSYIDTKKGDNTNFFLLSLLIFLSINVYIIIVSLKRKMMFICLLIAYFGLCSGTDIVLLIYIFRL